MIVSNFLSSIVLQIVIRKSIIELECKDILLLDIVGSTLLMTSPQTNGLIHLEPVNGDSIANTSNVVKINKKEFILEQYFYKYNIIYLEELGLFN